MSVNPKKLTTYKSITIRPDDDDHLDRYIYSDWNAVAVKEASLVVQRTEIPKLIDHLVKSLVSGDDFVVLEFGPAAIFLSDDAFVAPASLAEGNETADDVVERLQKSDETKRLTDALHAHRCHPDYEYAITQGPRKGEVYPPEGEGWEDNVIGDDYHSCWSRELYYDEHHWRRLLPGPRPK